MEFTVRFAGKVKAVLVWLVLVLMGTMALLLLELAGAVEVVASTVLAAVPVMLAVTTLSL
jgi:hypothetical protein